MAESFRFPAPSYALVHGEVYPCVLSIARYSGAYEGGKWVAFPESIIPSFVYGDDLSCSYGYEEYPLPIGRGETPTEAYEDLKRQVTDGR